MAQRRGLDELGDVAGNGSGVLWKVKAAVPAGSGLGVGEALLEGVGLLEKGGALLQGAGLGSAVARRRAIKQGQNTVAGGRWVRVQLSSEGEG